MFGQKLTDLRLKTIERKSIANETIPQQIKLKMHEMIVSGRIIGTESHSLDGIDYKSERTKGEKANIMTWKHRFVLNRGDKFVAAPLDATV